MQAIDMLKINFLAISSFGEFPVYESLESSLTWNAVTSGESEHIDRFPDRLIR